MIAPSSLRVFSAAQRLVDEARKGALAGGQHALFQQVRNDPRQATELLIVLAELVASERPPLVDESRRRLLRKAHAAYVRGDRLHWVIEGEREYQRNRKRITRWRERGAVETRRRKSEVSVHAEQGVA
jgi:hypothetical protein